MRKPMFTGSVVSATADGDSVEIEGHGAVAIAEGLIGGLVTRRVPRHELVHVLARDAGFAEEQIKLQGFGRLQNETFEIVVPLDGLMLDRPVAFAGVRLHPADFGRRALGELEPGPDLGTAFDAPVYALALATSRMMRDAEQAGIAKVDLALAWLITRLRYGLMTSPDGQAISFRRDESLVIPARRGVVAVRGLLSGRQWLRRPEVSRPAFQVSVDVPEWRTRADLPQATLQERLALLALARATREPEPLARVHALWEAIEFYAKGSSVPDLFDKSDLKSLKKALKASMPHTFSAPQRDRVFGLLAMSNDPPLMARLRTMLETDQVPYDSSEIDLLRRLRKIRNDVVHGHEQQLPRNEDLEHATSFVSRMMVYRLSKPRG